jgi:hypothetical protein
MQIRRTTLVDFFPIITILFLHILFFLTLLDLTDVCPLLTKQYIQFGLQKQYMLYNF